MVENDGDTVQTDEPLFVIETDKVTLEVAADTGGILKIKVKEGETVSIGAVVAVIETSGESRKHPSGTAREKQPGQTTQQGSRTSGKMESAGRAKQSEPEKKDIPEKEKEDNEAEKRQDAVTPEDNVSPSARRLAEEKQVDLSDVTPSGPGAESLKEMSCSFWNLPETGVMNRMPLHRTTGQSRMRLSR